MLIKLIMPIHSKILVLFSGCSASQYTAVWRRSTFQGPMAGLKRDTSSERKPSNVKILESI